MNRLEKAAAYLEKLSADQADQATQDQLDEIKLIAGKLRNPGRSDLNKAVWASVFSCLKIKAMHISNLLEEEEGKSF